MVAVVNSVEFLRIDEVLLVGLVKKPGAGDGSARWIKRARNDAPGVRGFLFEPVAVRNLIESGYIRELESSRT